MIERIIDLDKIPVILNEEKIQEKFDGDYKKALEEVLKIERNLEIKSEVFEYKYNKQKEVLDKIKEYVKEWREDDGSGSYGTLELLELLEEIE